MQYFLLLFGSFCSEYKLSITLERLLFAEHNNLNALEQSEYVVPEKFALV